MGNLILLLFALGICVGSSIGGMLWGWGGVDPENWGWIVASYLGAFLGGGLSSLVK